jgi:hypothetical protein
MVPDLLLGYSAYPRAGRAWWVEAYLDQRWVKNNKDPENISYVLPHFAPSLCPRIPRYLGE